MSFPVNTQQANLLPHGAVCTGLSPAALKSDAQNGPGSKIQSKPLSWITANTQNICLLCLPCCKGFEIPFLMFSEKPPPSKIFRYLWNKATIVPVFWNYYFTSGQKNVGTLQDFESKLTEFLGFSKLPQSPTVLSNSYPVWIFLQSKSSNISATVWIINRTENTFHFLTPKSCTLRLDSYSTTTRIFT